jgi:hypothetical protein
VNRTGRPTHPAAFVAAGLSAMIGLHALFLIGWLRVFANPPWPGYEESTRLGMVEPWFVNSPRSLWLTRIVFFGLSLAVVLPVRRQRVMRALALWAGAAVGVAITWATTTARTFEGGTAGFVYYPLRIGFPILAGAVAAAVVQRVMARRADA